MFETDVIYFFTFISDVNIFRRTSNDSNAYFFPMCCPWNEIHLLFDSDNRTDFFQKITLLFSIDLDTIFL